MREEFIRYFKGLGYIPIEDDVFNIAKRLRKYDNDLILFFNPRNKRYEVHSCTFFPSKRPTYCVSCEFLDYEIILKIRQADNRVIGFNEKMKMIDESKIKEEIMKAKKEEDLRDNFIREVKKSETKHFSMGG